MRLLADCIGMEATLKLLEGLGGTVIYIPSHQHLKNSFMRCPPRLIRNKHKFARDNNLSLRTVYYWFKTTNNEQEQESLF